SIPLTRRSTIGRWKPSPSQQRLLLGLDPRVAAQRSHDLRLFLPHHLARKLMRDRPGDMLGQPFDVLLARLLALGDVLGTSVQGVMDMATAAPALLGRNPEAVGKVVSELVAAAEQELRAKEPRALILAVLKRQPKLLGRPVGELREIMSLLAEHREASQQAKLLYDKGYDVDLAAGPLGAWLHAGLARALFLKYMHMNSPLGADDLFPYVTPYNARALRADPIMAYVPAIIYSPFHKWLDQVWLERDMLSSSGNSSGGSKARRSKKA
ncbi:hypothetical protein Agub_g2815, partial [Astrephomene gubernaculifera]